jgi:hypothetical protein
MDLSLLKKPFPADEIEWRIGRSGVKSDGTPWAMVLAYVTSRAIMDRLDEACGTENWCNEFKAAPEGGVMCGISIRIGQEWVTKWDGAENTDVEAVKGGLSGAMKRAGVQWGIGRYLYGLEEGFAKIHEGGKNRAKAKAKDGRDIAFKWDPPALPAWAVPVRTSTPPPLPPPPPPPPSPVGSITNAQKNLLEAEIGQAAKAEGLDPQAVREKLKELMFKKFAVSHFNELRKVQYDFVLNNILPAVVSRMVEEKGTDGARPL